MGSKCRCENPNNQKCLGNKEEGCSYIKESKYKERAIKILVEHYDCDDIEDLRVCFSEDFDSTTIVLEAMCQLAEEVEKENILFVEWLHKQIISYELYCKGKFWKYPDNDNWFTNEQLYLSFTKDKYYNKTLYTKEQVEELLQKQREYCVKKIKEDAMEDFGSDTPDCWNKDSILNAKLEI